MGAPLRISFLGACWQPPVAVDVCEVSLSVTPRWQVVAASGSLQLWSTIKQAFTGFKGIIDGITQGELSSAHPYTPWLSLPSALKWTQHYL